MNERLRQAIEDIVLIAREANGLAREDQEALAARLEAMAKELSWQQLFCSPDPTLDAMIGGASAADAAGEARPIS